MSITTVKANYYRIKFPTEDIRNDILSRGPWTFKDDWLALAAFNPNYNIDDYTFFSMNVWVRIYGIPSILMDDDDITHHTGNSLGAMIGTVVKVDTRRIDLNMIDYLRIGIVLDVTKPIRYIPPRKQESNTRSKGSIRYLDGARSSEPKIPANVAGAESTNAPTNLVDATVPMGAVIETPLMDATAPLGNIPAMETKLAAATISSAPNMASANTPHVAGSMPNKETTNVVPYLLDNVGLDAVTTTILPIPREGGLENDMGKSFLATSSMLIVFDDWLSKTSSLTVAMINNEIPTLIG
ncbi:hypothetical protein V6N11_075715 [Hibiscus sabdariffa]|uniref:DUF4283 domain-containing protein n=1 Tax=Hibiscus sabdariffa TaxID=183260 RepID=A0ABR2A5F2_9ROSI